MPLREPFEEKYEILEKIGQGGMGAVYKVRHRLLDELRVIKVIRSPLEPTPEAGERFQREARTACRLRHPNIALLHDFALGDDGRAFIVLEHIEGATLRELLGAHGTPPLSLALEIARQSAQALQYLHRQRIVHRDISPGNLMLTRDFEGRPLVKLIDLGLAKSLEAGGDGLTRGLFLGKVRYASPEQFDEGPIDERSDLYSLGVVLYELLTGHSPIAGHDARTWMAAHLFRPPLDFAESDPQDQVPEDLRALVLRLLAKDPAGRFASADELLRAVGEIQARFPLRGDEMDGVFGDEPATVPEPEPAAFFAVEEEPEAMAEVEGFEEEEDRDETVQTLQPQPPQAVPSPLTDLAFASVPTSARPHTDPDSVSLLLHRPAREADDGSMSIPLGRLELGAGAAGAGARLTDEPSWDAPARPREDQGFLYEPMDAEGEPAMAQREPVRRRSGLMVPFFVGLFSLAIVFALITLYSVTTEFSLGSAGSDSDSDIEEVTDPVAPPAEDAEQEGEIVAEETEAQPDAPEIVESVPLIEEIAGRAEPEPDRVPTPIATLPPPEPVRPAEPEPRSEPVRTARREQPPAAREREEAAPRRIEEPAPRRTEEPAPQVAQAPPARRQPVVREGGVRPGPGVMPPIPLEMPRYSYPSAARGQGVDIDVRLDLLVDEKGKVIEAVVREGDTANLGFNETAISAARRMSFQPATRGNQPVKMWTEMIFQFSEPDGGRRSGK